MSLLGKLRRVLAHVAERAEAASDRRDVRWHGEVRTVDGALERRLKDRVLWRAAPEQIVKVEAFKIPVVTVDRIGFDVHLEDGSVQTIDEDLAGWSAAAAWLQGLPGFARGWWNDVALPPMEPRRCVVYLRPPQAYSPRSRRR